MVITIQPFSNSFCITSTYKKEVLSQGISKITKEGILFVNKQALMGTKSFRNGYNDTTIF